MDNPKTPQKVPYKIEVEKGKIYFWCSCGLSKKQPFCDNSPSTEKKFKPIKYEADTNEELDFCGCKRSKRPPFCDGSHSWEEF